MSIGLGNIGSILERATQAVIEYYQLTAKKLGISGEYGGFVAAERLGPGLAIARTTGYDATDSAGWRTQINARSIQREKKFVGQQLGSIRLNQERDVVLLVVMDELFYLCWMFEEERPAIEEALKTSGSRGRNQQGSLWWGARSERC